jgi:ATP-dependent helicase
LFEHRRKLEEKERSVDELFDRFTNWVTETLTIQNNPYIRVVTVLMGVSK